MPVIRANKCDMERNILAQLIDWQNKTNRKPLILNGARQVGKTYILKEFGRTQYKNIAYVNCDNNDVVTKIFSRDYDIPASSCPCLPLPMSASSLAKR